MPTKLDVARLIGPGPIGSVIIVCHGPTLVAVDFGTPEDVTLAQLRRRFGSGTFFEEADDPHGFKTVISSYFSGEINALETLDADGGGTPFQRSVWAQLRQIPAGETRTYGQLASRLGNPKAMRAVGLANGSNPVNLVVPCHRVIGASGALTSYGPGLPLKKWLLEFEASFTSPGPLLSGISH